MFSEIVTIRNFAVTNLTRVVFISIRISKKDCAVMLTLGRGFLKVSNSVFQSQILPKVAESGHYLHTIGEDVVEFSLKNTEKLGKPVSFLRKHFETFMFQFRKWFSSWQDEVTQKFGEFVKVEKTTTGSGEEVIGVKNHLGEGWFDRNKKGKYTFKFNGKAEASGSDTVKTTMENLDWVELPDSVRETILRSGWDKPIK